MLVVTCSALIASINAGDANRKLFPDFGPGSPDPRLPRGIPFTVVDSDPAKCQTFAAGPTNFLLYPEESDLTAGTASHDCFAANLSLQDPHTDLTHCHVKHGQLHLIGEHALRSSMIMQCS